jgi:hypothetical protein
MVTLSPKQLLIWFSVVSTILVLFGIVYTFFGLAILPVDRETLLPWEGAIYGALMAGWGTTLLCVGRLAFRRNDVGLMKGLLYGLVVWLVVEAAVSVYYRVWFVMNRIAHQLSKMPSSCSASAGKSVGPSP